LGQGNLRGEWCYDLAKQLSHYLYFLFFSFLFFYLGLTTQKGVQESVMSQVSQIHSVTSHDRCGKLVHRPCSSCISSIKNPIETSLSFSCQLGLGG